MESTALTLPARAAIALQSTAAEAHLRELLAGTVGITSVTNRAGREECHKAAMAITKARTAIVSAGKTARDDANAFSKAVIAEERRLIGIVEAEETRLKGLRDAWDAEQARIREEAERKEKARIDGILARIQILRDYPGMAATANLERAKGLFSELAGFSIGDSFGEYKEKALGVLQDARAAVASIVDAKIAAEEEAARIKAEAEAAILAAEAAAAAHAAELAELRKQQEAAEEQRRIEAAAAKAEQDRLAEVARKEREAERAEQERIQAERDRIAAEELRIEREATAKALAELAAKEAEIAEQQRAIQAEKDAKEAAERAERERVEAEQEAKKTAEWRRFAERLELISDRCAGMEWWQLDEVIIAIDELLAKWAGATNTNASPHTITTGAFFTGVA